MALFNARTLSDTVEDLLERERVAVLAGNLEGLTRLVAEKSRLMERMARSKQPPLRIEKLRNLAHRNQTLLHAAADGIKSVATQVTGAQTRKTALNTYDASGSRKEIFRTRSMLEKRA